MKINAITLRQEFGRVLQKLAKSKVPIIIEKQHKPVAVLISMEMYQLRFVDLQMAQQRTDILKAFDRAATDAKEDSLSVLRGLRYG